jgi:hypothetical protein
LGLLAQLPRLDLVYQLVPEAQVRLWVLWGRLVLVDHLGQLGQLDLGALLGQWARGLLA